MTTDKPQRPNYTFALSMLSLVFFIFGFVTSLNNILIPHLKKVFSLTDAQSQLVNSAFFGAFFILSIPSGSFIKKIGYKNGLLIGLILIGVGCLMFYPAAAYGEYFIFLIALFVLASGVVILQVASNPYAAAMGPAETASSRLTLTQAINSFGTMVAPIFGAVLIFNEAEKLSALEAASSVKMPYVGLALLSVLIAVIIKVIKLPHIDEEDDEEPNGDVKKIRKTNVWQFRHLLLGALAIFVYVGAEVGIASFFVNYATLDLFSGSDFMTPEYAGWLLSFYWGGAMAGRFIGVVTLKKFKPAKVLLVHAVIAATLVLISILTNGSIALWTILAVGLFNSVMFPVIFGLSLKGLGRFTKQGSGILCTAIVGGALIPPFMGLLSDAFGKINTAGIIIPTSLSYQTALAIAVICYIYIAFFALKGAKMR